MNINPPHFSRREFNRLLSLSCVSPILGAFVSAKDVQGKPLFTQYGVCTRLTTFDHYKKAGYDYLEDATSSLLMPTKSDKEFASTLTKLKETKTRVLACNSFLPGRLKCVGKEANHESVLDYAGIVFKRAKLAGLKGIVFGSAGARKIQGDFKREVAEQQFVDLLKKMAPLAHEQGMEVWIEPLNRKEDNLINTQAQGAAMIEKVNHPALGMVCDIFHVMRNEETPEDVLKTVEYVRHCHIAEKKKRSAPSTEGDDFSLYLEALKKSHYSGSLSMECGWDNLNERPRLALEYVQKQVAALETEAVYL